MIDLGGQIMKCRQCGFKIVRVEWGRNYYAQNRGFCCAGCEEVNDKVHAWEYRAALEKSRKTA